jgi:KamA family protein
MEKKYKVYNLHNFREAPQIKKHLSEEEKHVIEVVGSVLPFKVNNYVLDNLIDWANIPNDPIFQLTFPQKGMLLGNDFNKVDKLIKQGADRQIFKEVINNIRFSLNPHPAGQQKNIPEYNGVKLTGVQHKYRETVLFFPSNGQTCHAYCTFCFRWPQFTGIDELKFAMNEAGLLAGYIKNHPEITDLLFTGGDPMVMSAKKFNAYIEPLINNNIPHLRNIRIGSKSLSYWPYRFTDDKDADEMLKIFEKIVKQGYHLAFMAHFNHPNELKTDIVRKAIKRIQNTGAVIRTQSPVMRHINDDASAWSEMWKDQVKLGIVPYYMFMARDTGAHGYFSVTLERAWEIFNEAYRKISGITRTAKGPVMSSDPGKVHVLGITEIMGKKVFVLRFVQGRDPEWVGKPFFAEYDPGAYWITDLKPAFEESFFFEKKNQNIELLN